MLFVSSAMIYISAHIVIMHIPTIIIFNIISLHLISKIILTRNLLTVILLIAGAYAPALLAYEYLYYRCRKSDNCIYKLYDCGCKKNLFDVGFFLLTAFFTVFIHVFISSPLVYEYIILFFVTFVNTFLFFDKVFIDFFYSVCYSYKKEDFRMDLIINIISLIINIFAIIADIYIIVLLSKKKEKTNHE